MVYRPSFKKKKSKKRKVSYLKGRKKNFEPHLPAIWKKANPIRKGASGKEAGSQILSNVRPHLYLQLPIKSCWIIPGSCNSPFPQGDLISKPSLQSDSHRACGFHLQKPVPLQPLTGELARWCLLQSSVSASRLALTYTPGPHRWPRRSTAEQADSSSWKE